MITLRSVQTFVDRQPIHFAHRLPRFGSRCFFALFLGIASSMTFADSLPQDNPPLYPLQRSNPKLHDVTLSVGIPWNQAYPPRGGAVNPIRWPIVPRANWAFAVNAQPLVAELKNGQNFLKEANAWNLCKQLQPPGQWELPIPIAKRCYGSITFEVRIRMNCFSSQLDENAAATIGWPQQWQGDSKHYLEPSDFIESSNEIFSKAVLDALGEHKQSMSVHHAAKTIIRYCLQKIKSDGQYEDRTRTNVRGLAVQGATKTVEGGFGTACDLVTVCVATLRAAGIPARPVIGMTNKDLIGTRTTQSRYLVWAEYALPNAGWVPFDPKRMQGTVDRVLLKDSWQGLGTMMFLNERVPIAFSFVAGGVQNAYDAIGPWGWVPIFQDRPLPVPQTLVSIPWYQTATEETFVLVPYGPSTQRLGVVSLGSGTSSPPRVDQ
jgi:hypothetical protein